MDFFDENRVLLEANFLSFDQTLTFPAVMSGPTQNLDPIGSAVLTFIGHKQTNTQVQAKYYKKFYMKS